MKTTDYNSTKNQQIKEKFVSTHVYHGVNETIQMLQQCESHDYSDELEELIYSVDKEQTIINYLDGLTEDELIEIAEDLEVTDTTDTGAIYKMIDDDDLFIELHMIDDYVYNEPYEFYAVSNFLGDKLRKLGHPVQDILDFTVWGRCTTGQAILLDYAISKICEEMEILEGQDYEWKI